ncbi:leucine-rich repeat receptor-like serine/threonine-protein kinase RGI4 isoform X4 [Daucus carota subsp. sativus]|uniref:leucine-rich repeat receptor-like serine/threonine-protein kinase RGI4 isoform X4 n=1 Tax=Daucus carota subsp. sativus TaxID=79200 RepID=UPI0030831A78
MSSIPFVRLCRKLLIVCAIPISGQKSVNGRCRWMSAFQDFCSLGLSRYSYTGSLAVAKTSIRGRVEIIEIVKKTVGFAGEDFGHCCYYFPEVVLGFSPKDYKKKWVMIYLLGVQRKKKKTHTHINYWELNDNQLSGHIPPALEELTDLFDLNVAKNHLEGPIPDNLSSCTNLNSLNVFGDKLNRTIPSAFKRLESITYLDLSNKSIAVATPWPIGDLEHLLKLDLSHNNLSGPISKELSQLQNIFSLNVSYNNLAGVFLKERTSWAFHQIVSWEIHKSVAIQRAETITDLCEVILLLHFPLLNLRARRVEREKHWVR